MRKMGFFRLRSKCSLNIDQIGGIMENSNLKTVLGRDEPLSHKKIKRVPICTWNEGK
jgi:hypothetical protein